MANILYPQDFSQARSPLLLQYAPETDGQDITSADVEVSIYTGDKTSGVPASPQVTLVKSGVDGNVLLDVAQLVRAYFVHNYTSHNAPGASTYYIAQAIGSALWVKVSSNTTELSGGYLEASTFLAMDGFSYFADGVNKVHSETILTTPRTIQLLEGQYFNLPVKNDPRIKWGIGQVGSVTTYQDAPAHGDDTDKKVVYLPVGKPNINSLTDLSMDLVAATKDFYVFIQNQASSAALANIRIQYICEPKYEGHYIAFINKWGVWDTMLFEKKSSENIKVQGDSYRRMIGAFSARDGETGTQAYTYNTREGVQARINAVGQEYITLNTGFLEEDYNEVMRQLLQSEVFLLDNTTPVTIETVDLDYKTGINERLIQYTIQFKYAFEAINRVI
jgi:hypothetical protein